jgi:hypothetical protein
MDDTPKATDPELVLRLDALATALASAAYVPFWDKRLTREEVAMLAALFRARLDWWQSNVSDEELDNIRQAYLGSVTC